LWSVVTGYIEAGAEPVAQAWVEVAEELGLGPPELSLCHQLPAVPRTSLASAKAFLVYPFLFECMSIDGVVLNWEHDSVKWVEPAWLDQPECVPWQAPLVRSLLSSSSRPPP
jgi:8-oxo-dGTP pyrophosphatase MutT (NUDIX family)